MTAICREIRSGSSPAAINSSSQHTRRPRTRDRSAVRRGLDTQRRSRHQTVGRPFDRPLPAPASPSRHRRNPPRAQVGGLPRCLHHDSTDDQALESDGRRGWDWANASSDRSTERQPTPLTRETGSVSERRAPGGSNRLRVAAPARSPAERLAFVIADQRGSDIRCLLNPSTSAQPAGRAVDPNVTLTNPSPQRPRIASESRTVRRDVPTTKRLPDTISAMARRWQTGALHRRATQYDNPLSRRER